MLRLPLRQAICDGLGKVFSLIDIAFKEKRLHRKLPDGHWGSFRCFHVSLLILIIQALSQLLNLILQSTQD